MMLSIKITRMDVPALLVDRGRYGFQHQGVTPCGPLDENAFFWANALVNNTGANKANALEIIAGCEFLIERTLHIAITGPNVIISVNGKTRQSWHSMVVHQGDRLLIESQKPGQRYYLAVAGGWRAPYLLGSQSTSLREAIGGLDGHGQTATVGEYLHCNAAQRAANERFVKAFCYDLTTPIRVILSYQSETLGSLACARFFSMRYGVSPNSNRMGLRLQGCVKHTPPQAMLSEGLSTGAIQLPPDGHPIVMLADRQTLGGYPKIGAVAQVDLPRLAQAVPGDLVSFQPTDVYSAQNALHLRECRRQKLVSSFYD